MSRGFVSTDIVCTINGSPFRPKFPYVIVWYVTVAVVTKYSSDTRPAISSYTVHLIKWHGNIPLHYITQNIMNIWNLLDSYRGISLISSFSRTNTVDSILTDDQFVYYCCHRMYQISFYRVTLYTQIPIVGTRVTSNFQRYLMIVET